MPGTKRTKIIATFGPASNKPEVLKALLAAGTDVFRFNLAHGSHANHARGMHAIRRLAKRSGQHVGILVDLGGPKLRVRTAPEGLPLVRGTEVVFGSSELTLNHPAVLHQLRSGMTLLLDDGNLRLVVTGKRNMRVSARVIESGLLRNNAGFAIPKLTPDLPFWTPKDRRDLSFALRRRVDAIALSFVRDAHDVIRVRRAIKSSSAPLLIAKIETPSAVEHIDGILQAADGIMIARGDLGLSVPLPELPHIQKQLILKALAAAKPVITATQMLESMMRVPIPSRAEITDVTNAMLDGTDAVLLSKETTQGAHPVESVQLMRTIAERSDPETPLRMFEYERSSTKEIGHAISESVVRTAEHLNATAIVVFTESGKAARLIACHRPPQPIFAFSPKESVLRQLTLLRGVVPCRTRPLKTADDAVRMAENTLRRLLPKKRNGGLFVASSGIPFRKSGTTNMLYVGKIHA